MKHTTEALAMAIVEGNVQRLVRDYLKDSIVVPQRGEGKDEELEDTVQTLLDRMLVQVTFYGD